MNPHLVYDDASGFYVPPESDTAGGLATWRQPIIGEDGYQVARSAPAAVSAPASFDVTFEAGVTPPRGFHVFIEAVIVGVLDVEDGWPEDYLLASHGTGNNSDFWYAHPRGPDARRHHRIRNATMRFLFAAEGTPNGGRTVSFTRVKPVRITFMRATYGAKPAEADGAAEGSLGAVDGSASGSSTAP